MTNRFLDFLKPTREKAVFLLILAFISLGGYIQSYAFSDGSSPKPPFYDAIHPFPFWELWIAMVLPVAILSGLFENFYIFAFLMLVYLYLLSCLVSLASSAVVVRWPGAAKTKRYPYVSVLAGIGILILFVFLVLVLVPLAQSALVAVLGRGP